MSIVTLGLMGSTSDFYLFVLLRFFQGISGAMWDGTTYATINPLGQFLGALIMFVVLGLIPGYVIAKILHGMGKLRIPRDVEIAGLDYEMMESAKKDERAVSSATR